LPSSGAKPAVGVVALPTSVVAELSWDASAGVNGEIAVDADSVRFASGPKLNPDTALPDPNDGTEGAEVVGTGDLVGPAKSMLDAPKPKLVG
jgi:hypothetical protein